MKDNTLLYVLGAAAAYLYVTNNGPSDGTTWWDTWFNPAVRTDPLSHARQGISGIVPVTLSNAPSALPPSSPNGVQGQRFGIGYIVPTGSVDSIPSMSFGGALRQPSGLSY